MHTGRQNRMNRQKLKHKAPGRQARFRMADDVLILQPFELEVFQQDIPQQAELLLKYIGLENKEDIHADIEALNPILTSRARAGNGRHDGHRYEH